MIDPTTGWFEIVELPVAELSVIPSISKGCRGKNTRDEPKEVYFDNIDFYEKFENQKEYLEKNHYMQEQCYEFGTFNKFFEV